MKALRLAAFALIAVAASATSMATNYNLGTLTVPGSGQQISTVSGASFTDTFQFSFTAPFAFPGGVLFDYTPYADVTLTNVNLLDSTSTLLDSHSLFGAGPFVFGFNQVTTGSYYVQVLGTTNNGSSGSYTAKIALVPEPGTLALFGLGLSGAAFAARRGMAVRAA